MAHSIYTDLAMESRELSPGIDGVEEETYDTEGISVSRIRITTDEAARRLQKPVGRYTTIDAPELSVRPLDLFLGVSRVISRELARLMSEAGLARDGEVLIVGLGNRAVTPDSLGPRTAEAVFVTRHINEYMPDALPSPVRSVCAIAPGVLGVTGVETMEIVRGVVERVKPKLIIAIDSLASRRAARISTTVQLTDTGINPGAGIGNDRKGLNSGVFGVPVIAIGVPMVVHASTISQDTISLIASETGLHGQEAKLSRLAQRVVDEHMGQMIVTPKEIDQIAADMSRVISDGINMALFGLDYDDVKMLIA